jgi:rSAM/selenodomain-associated transferase 1
LRNGRVIVFLKAPRPGFVKTRIAAQLDAEAAAAIYQVLVGITLSRLNGRQDVELRFAPDDAAAELGAWRRAGWNARPQGEGDLGERLCRAMTDAFTEGVSNVLILGADCPEFGAEDIQAAFEALNGHDVVLGPATDGGYWLVGLGRSLPEVFREIPWSTDQVFEMTRRRSVDAGLRVAELRRLRDIDTLEDWRTWLREQPL